MKSQYYIRFPIDLSKTELGGVPITVAIPPAFAENAIPSITLNAKFLSFLVKPSSSLINKLITESAMGKHNDRACGIANPHAQ